VKLNYIYIYIYIYIYKCVCVCANNGSEKLCTKSTATSGKLITAVYASYVKIIIFVQVSQVG